MPKPADQQIQRQLGARLRELRAQHAYGQQELAELIGVSVESVSRAERGLLTPSLPTVVRLADVYGLTLDELLGREQPRRTPRSPNAEAAARLVAKLPEGQADAVLALLRSMAPARRRKRS